jgi:hypothetical protein
VTGRRERTQLDATDVRATMFMCRFGTNRSYAHVGRVALGATPELR